MGGACTIRMSLFITGLGPENDIHNKFTATVPVEYTKMFSIIGTSSQQLDHGDVALTNAYLLWIKAEVGTIYIKLNSTSGDLSSSDGPIVLETGETNIISINPDDNVGIRVDGSMATSAISYIILGKT